MTSSWLVRVLIWRVSGRLLVLGHLEHPGDVADLGGHAGRDDDHLARPAGDVGVHVGHAVAVAERRVLGHGVDVLGGRQALSGERRLVDLERGGRDDPAVRGDEVAGLERDDVARHELLGRDLPQLAVAAHACLDDHHLLERRHRGRGLALLAEAQVRVEDRQQDQHHAGRHLLDGVDREQAGDQQHDLHRIGVLAQEGVPARLGLLGRELVWPDLGPAALDLGAREALDRIDLLAGERVLDREGVPRPHGVGGRRRTGHGNTSASDGDLIVAAIREWWKPLRRTPPCR